MGCFPIKGLFPLGGRRVVTPPLPYDAEVEYLESTGVQYVDTGIVPTDSTGVEVEHTICANNGTDNILFGARQSSGNTRYMEDIDWSGKTIGWGFNTYSDGVSRYSLTGKEGLLITSSLNYLNDRRGKVDGVAYDSSLSSKTLASIRRTIYLFGLNYTAPSNLCACRIFSCNISDGTALVRSFVPVRIGQVGYLFDRANPKGGPSGNGLYGSATSTPLVSGPDINGV